LRKSRYRLQSCRIGKDSLRPVLSPCLLVVALALVPLARAQVNVLTANYDNLRTDANLQETILKPSNVNQNSFGKLGSFPVDGQIYAQPLYVSGVQIGGKPHNVVYIVTMHNSVYAIDADNPQSTTPLWRLNFGPAVLAGLFNFTDILPEIGILSTPVIDLSRQVIYMVSDTLPSGPAGETLFQLHALSLVDGHEMLNGPVTITASVPGTGVGTSSGSIVFDPSQQLQRPGLALANGTVYVAFGSHGDSGAYHGWLFSYDASNIQHQIAVFNTAPNGEGDSIWQAGRAPAIDDQNNIYVVTANGDYDGVSSFGESALRLSTPDLKLQDWYTPQEWSSWNNQDLDLGSSGALLVPNTDLVLTGGKSGILYLFRRDSMGHLGPDNTTTVQGLQVTGDSILNIALWASQNGPIAYEYETGGSLKAFRIVDNRLALAPLSTYTPAASSTYAGLAVSANGGTSETGIAWLTTGDYTTGAVRGTLHALNASNLSQELWNSDMAGNRDALGRLAKFVAPTVVNGQVFVPTFSNELTIYGPLPAGQQQPLPGSGAITAVVSGASFLTSPVSPGELVSIFGANLGPTDPVDGEIDATNHVAESLSSTQVLFDSTPAPLLFASNDQMNVVVPFGIAGPTTQVQILYQGQTMSTTTVPVQAAAPSLFSLDRTGGGPGAILNQDGSVNTRDNPAARGSVVVLYATGGGQTKPASEDGAITAGPEYPILVLPVTVFIGDQPAEVLYAGAAPGIIAGVLQINIRIPATAQPTFAAQVTVKVGDFASPTAVTMGVK
jgi:uncharacterized protein (TIGR03437 family)